MAQERLREQRYVLFPLAQWRHRDVHHVQPKIEIVAEFSLGHETLEIFICRRHQPHVRLQSLVATDAFKRSFFANHTQ